MLSFAICSRPLFAASYYCFFFFFAGSKVNPLRAESRCSAVLFSIGSPGLPSSQDCGSILSSRLVYQGKFGSWRRVLAILFGLPLFIQQGTDRSCPILTSSGRQALFRLIKYHAWVPSQMTSPYSPIDPNGQVSGLPLCTHTTRLEQLPIYQPCKSIQEVAF